MSDLEWDQRKCYRCHKVFNHRYGWTTTWAGRFIPPVWLCLRCMDEMGIEDAREKQAKQAKLAAEIAAARENYSEADEDKIMVQILRELSPNSGWVKLTRINALFRAKIVVQGKSSDTRYVSRILKRLGFDQMKRMEHGFMHVYVSWEDKGK